jgi:hypothetical protein
MGTPCEQASELMSKRVCGASELVVSMPTSKRVVFIQAHDNKMLINHCLEGFYLKKFDVLSSRESLQLWRSFTDGIYNVIESFPVSTRRPFVSLLKKILF